MIETIKYNEEYIVNCNRCSYDETYETDFHDMLNELKENGWKMEYLEDEWNHFCPTCVMEEIKDDFKIH